MGGRKARRFFGAAFLLFAGSMLAAAFLFVARRMLAAALRERLGMRRGGAAVAAFHSMMMTFTGRMTGAAGHAAILEEPVECEAACKCEQDGKDKNKFFHDVSKNPVSRYNRPAGVETFPQGMA